MTYGYTEPSKEHLRKILSEELSITFHEISNGNFAYRFGEFAETISIINHYEKEDDWWSYPKFKHCKILVTISITQGKNQVKKEKFDFLKEKLSQIPNLIHINTSVFEN
jgi:hypothetical protein